MLTRDIRWTRALGDAFLNQQADVMNAIQTMRASARANGRLQSNPQQQVTVEQNLDPQYGNQQAIAIQPTNPEVIYPPQYDPGYVWGPPAYGAYPDLYYPDYGFGYYPPVYLGSYFGGFGGYGGWGWGFNWFGGGLFVNSVFFNHYGFHNGFYGNRGFGNGFHNTWAHDPGHRQGIPYPNRAVASRFNNGAPNARGSSTGRSFNQGFANQRSGSERSAGQGFRSFSNTPSQSRTQGFRNFSNSAPQARQQQSFRGFSNPSQQRSFQSARPQQSFRPSAPQQHFSAAPRMSAPSGGGFRGGGGGGGGFHGGGGGGGGARSGGGAGGSRGGGGGHR
jgi:hypothetical protein